MTDKSRGRTWLVNDSKKLEQNVRAFESVLPKGAELMPAVKANAYGHGGVLISKKLNEFGVKAFCVASAKEGAELRAGGVEGEILVLGYSSRADLDRITEFDLIQTIVDLDYAKMLKDWGKQIKTHIGIDSGMHRIGEFYDKTEEIADIFKIENIEVKGIFTHFSSADSDDKYHIEFTKEQNRKFRECLADLRARGCNYGKVHSLNTTGLLRYSGFGGDYARVGIGLYGYMETRAQVETCPVSLSPVMSICTNIEAVKEVKKGDAIGYGCAYKPKGPGVIAALSIGYADGLPRALGNEVGEVIINGEKAPIVGRICMDQCMVEVSKIKNVKAGDIATIIGREGNVEISAYDIAEKTNSITNEVLSRLGGRIERFMD
jgi:serine/alanine racemase